MIGRGVYYIYIYIYIYISARTFFYLSKYSLSDAHFSTGRLLFEFNRLQYTLAAPEVFVSSANPVGLPSGYRVSIVRNTNIDQIETTPLRYCMLPTPGTGEFFFWTHFRLRKFSNQWGQRSSSTRSHTPRRPSLAAAEI